MSSDARAEIASLAKQLSDAMERQPDDYASRVAWALEYQRAATQALAAALETPANRYLKSVEKGSFAERAKAVETFRHDAAQLSLAVKCPKTGEPSALFLRARDPLDPDRGGDIYTIQHRRGAAGRSTYGYGSSHLPKIELLPFLGARYRGDQGRGR